MYQTLKNNFKNIVVTGPQRSGTRIATKIIAVDTGKEYIDEKDINFHDFRLLEYYLNEGNVVIQCPGLCHMVHYIKQPATLIIMILRDIDDIISSQNRIGWYKFARLEELHKYGCTEGIISRIKYNFWNTYQKPLLGEKARTIDYEYLKHHPFFVSKQKRKDFTWDQVV